MTEIRSARVNTASMSCSTSTIVTRPLRPPRRRTIRCDSSRPMPATGSSSRSSRGRVANAMAISSCRCSPCARLAARTSARSPRPTESRTASAGARRARSARAGRQKRKLWPECAWTASATLSTAVKSRKMLVIWKERASPSRDRVGASSDVTSWPAKRVIPASGLRSPAIWPISVVLPAPLGPMTACVSPSGTSRSTRSVARRPPKLLLSPRITISGSAIAQDLSRQEPEQAALGEEHHEDQEQPQDDLPVLGQGGEHVLEPEEHDRADHGPEQRSHPAEDHHEHDLAGPGPVHELGGEVLGRVREQRAGEAARAPGEDEGDELVAERREADRPRARLVGLRGPDDHAEASVDEPVAQDQEEHEQRQNEVVERVRVPEVDEPGELAARPERHPVVAAIGLEADPEVVEHLREGERDHDEGDAAGPDRDRTDDERRHRRHRDLRPQLEETFGAARACEA